MKRLVCFLEIFIFISTSVYACSIFWVRDNLDHVLVGRNFDNDKEGGRIQFIPPSEGKYEIVILEQLGKNMPYEGMNEKGLFNFSLEKRYNEWLHLSLGMGLYPVLGEKKPGVNFSIGWEPTNTIPFKPYLVLRSEILMENSLKPFYSIILDLISNFSYKNLFPFLKFLYF